MCDIVASRQDMATGKGSAAAVRRCSGHSATAKLCSLSLSLSLSLSVSLGCHVSATRQLTVKNLATSA